MRTIVKFAVISVAPLTACNESRTTAPQAASPPTVVAILISPDSALMWVGGTQSYDALKVMSNGSRVPVRANWASKNLDVLTMSANGFAVAVGDGRAAIQATAEGLVAVSSVTVQKPTSIGESNALIVEAFSMMELQYFVPSDTWFYVPQVRVRAEPGRSVTILRAGFSIPGVQSSIPPWSCGASISATVSRELNGEVYGDWVLTMESPGQRARREDATAIISFVDDSGVVATRTVRGPIVAGSLPRTYSGGEFAGACFQGYRPPG